MEVTANEVDVVLLHGRMQAAATRSDLTKQFKFHCGVTCVVQQSARVWTQRLKLNLDGETIDPNSLFRDLAVRVDRNATDQTTIFVRLGFQICLSAS